MSHITINSRKRFGVRYLSPMMMIIGILLLSINVTYRHIHIDKPYPIDSIDIKERIDNSFWQTNSICRQWLDANNDSLFIERLWSIGIAEKWDKRRVSLLLFDNDSLMFWSNHYFSQKVDPDKFNIKNSVVQFNTHKIIFRKYISGNKTALVLLNLHSSYTGLNTAIFDNQKLYVFDNQEQPQPEDKLTVIDNYIRLKPELVTAMPLYIRLMGWMGLFITILAIKRYFRKKTTSKNIFWMTTLFATTLACSALFFAYFSLQNDPEGGKFAQNITTIDGYKFTVGKLLIIFSAILIFTIYIFNIKSKFRYAYRRLNSTWLKWALFVILIVVINATVVFFHYSMVNIIYNSNINVELYKLTSLSFASFIFYVVSIFFVASRMLINKVVRLIFSEMSNIVIIPLSLIVLTCMIIPIENGIYDTGYILILFHLAYLLITVFENKTSSEYVFTSLIIIFSAYILLFSAIESYNADQLKAGEYAGIIAHNDANTNHYQSTDEYQKFTYYKLDNHNFEVKEDNNFELQNLTDIITYNSDTVIRRFNVVHSLFHFNNGIMVLVSRTQVTILDYLAYFSYIFCILFICCNVILRVVGVKRRKVIQSKFALKIKFMILSTVVLTMIMVVVVIVINALDNYRLSQKQVMNNQMRSIINSLNNFTVRYNGTTNNFLSEWFNNNSELSDKYISTYDIQGNLTASTIPPNQISLKINSQAMSAFREIELPLYNTNFVYENIKYNSSFIPGYFNQKRVGYINLIQKDRVNNIATDIRYDLIVKMLNILIVVIMVALILSIMLYRNIAKPLNSLYEGMSNISALKRIEQSGRAKDEISILITQYNRMIDYIEESYVALAQAEREGAWRNMSRQVAHEIKNPLTPMRLKVQMLQKAKERKADNLDSQIDSTLELILKQIDLLADIANQFSDFANIGKVKNELVSVSKLITSINDLYNSIENIRFVTEIIDHKMMINVDYTQMHRVFVNLCQNSIQAIGKTRRGVIKITAMKDGNRVIFTVQDNGSGINEENKKKVFSPNFSTKTSGSGLGLAMSREIVLNCGGIIRFNSQQGIGTTFVVILPLALESSDEPPKEI